MDWKRGRGGNVEGGKVALKHLPMVETLTDGLGSLSNSPRRDSSRSSYKQSWHQHPRTHAHTNSGEDRGWNHTLSTRDCACNANEVHLNLCRPIREGKKEGWNRQGEAKAGHTDWKTTEKWWLPWSVHNWECTTVKRRRCSLDRNLKGIQQAAWTD